MTEDNRKEAALARFVITSSTWRNLDRESFSRLSQRYRRSRAGLGITGLMLYEDGNLLQLLEGPEVVLDRIYRSTLLDSNYNKVVKLFQRDIVDREFTGHSSAYGVVGQQAFTCMETNRAYFIEMDEFRRIKPDKTKNLVQGFVAGKWRLKPLSAS